MHKPLWYFLDNFFWRHFDLWIMKWHKHVNNLRKLVLKFVISCPLFCWFCVVNVKKDPCYQITVLTMWKKILLFITELVCLNFRIVKGGLSLKTKNWHIHLYFIATKSLLNNALVEYINNWTKLHSLVIIYWFRQKIIFNSLVIKDF